MHFGFINNKSQKHPVTYSRKFIFEIKTLWSTRLVSFWVAIWLDLLYAMSFKMVLWIGTAIIRLGIPIAPFLWKWPKKMAVIWPVSASTKRMTVKGLVEHVKPTNAKMCMLMGVPIVDTKWGMHLFPVWKRNNRQLVCGHVAFALTIVKMWLVALTTRLNGLPMVATIQRWWSFVRGVVDIALPEFARMYMMIIHVSHTKINANMIL